VKTFVIEPEKFEGIWSAAPTPFDAKMRVDTVAVKRLMTHHLRLGVKGVFLAGTCGEGPWITEVQRRRLVTSTATAAKGRLTIAVQVTDNSAARMLDNIAIAKEDGADLAVIAQPYFLMNATPNNIEALYLKAFEGSVLPVVFYDRGKHSSVFVPDRVLKTLYAHPKVVAVKDSSSDPARRAIALAARRKRPELRLLNGDEFHCDEYVLAGYDGLMLGGAAFNGYLAGLILRAARDGDAKAAKVLQERMNRIMYAVYGGKKISCWLAGFKQYLVEIDVFSTPENCLGYKLSPSCAKAIAHVLKADAEVLLP
jgi:4-hydroxy-tetrahydrodipicolinate synthase